jgi:hypothetical protein
MSTSRNPDSCVETLFLEELTAQDAKVEAQWEKTSELHMIALCEDLLNYDDDTTVSLKAELDLLESYIKEYRDMLGAISVADIVGLFDAAGAAVDEAFQTVTLDMQEMEDKLQFYELWIHGVWLEINR